MQEDYFVLDIGTRSVMALLARMDKGNLAVSHLLFKEHKSRAMLDGQIHHVEQVAEIIKELVEEMKSISGQEFKKVSAAAAGRALLTMKGTAKTKFPASTVITKEERIALELQGMQNAQLALPKKFSDKIPLSQQYYCVGYSVLQETLDGIKLGTITGQKGQEAEIEVVATFLPRIVVDSLQIAVQQAGLELCGITLEPIAVANLVLNKSMRRLNLVLVDIGAGTSDIAICEGDSISAFGMVPMAGDEVTEAISDMYLLDFNKAEEAKRKLDSCAEIATTDVLGNELIINSTECKAGILPVVESLASAIAQEILSLNNKAPQAVLLVGGGSLTPGLPAALAQVLEVPANRIVVQQAGKLEQVNNLDTQFSGPSFITVLGIAYTFLTCPTMGFIKVKINGEAVKLLHLAQNTIAEALLNSGHNLKDIYGRPGLALTCEINGHLYTIPGKPGRPGRVLLNGKETLFSEYIKDGDEISFEPGSAGENGQGTFQDILDKDSSGSCQVNGKTIALNPVIKSADQTYSLDDPIPEGCKVQVSWNQTIFEVLRAAGLTDGMEHIWINQKKIRLVDLAKIKKNGKKAGLQEEIEAGDIIDYRLPQLKVGDVLPEEAEQSFNVFVNGKSVTLRKAKITVNDKPAEWNTQVFAGDKIEYEAASQIYHPILIDIFREIEFSPQPPPGKSHLLLMVNNEQKEYTYELQQGDKIQISWV